MKKLVQPDEDRILSNVELLELEISISHYFLNNPIALLKQSLGNLGNACENNNEWGMADIENMRRYLKLMDSTFENAFRFFCLNNLKKTTALITVAKPGNHGK